MTETQLLESVLGLCKLMGARTLHIRPARTATGWRTPVQGDGKGFPDLLILTKRGRLLFRELKAERGKLSGEQREWLHTLTNSGHDADIWRPIDWPDRIKEDLGG